MIKKKVFIIGNGFDLDLGWKTRYSDFAGSSYGRFKENYSYTCLVDFLRRKDQTQKWFDLEMALREYASTANDEYKYDDEFTRRDDYRVFEKLTNNLMDYLSKEQQKPINTDSIAAKVFRSIIENGYFTSIYTFNYTNLGLIAKQLDLGTISFEYVHGSIEKRSAILGVEDKTDLRSGYSFLYKTFNRYYESHHIQYDMAEADEIVFFGHSLGRNDYHYFQQLFRTQSSENLQRANSKRITIFTYDDASRIGILEQLREMNDKNTNLLFSLNDFQFICTKENITDKERLRRFLDHLAKDSLVEKRRQA
ncbi:AbiH family protein [Parabacteroides merdae]|uniref:AbiH family protein n=1 Tax=Parabacteroides merdae TaxID=46503 RepID=UPI0039B3B3C6